MQTNVDTWSFSILFYQFNSLNKSYLYQIVFFFKECVCFSIFFVICGGFFLVLFLSPNSVRHLVK